MHTYSGGASAWAECSIHRVPAERGHTVIAAAQCQAERDDDPAGMPTVEHGPPRWTIPEGISRDDVSQEGGVALVPDSAR